MSTVDTSSFYHSHCSSISLSDFDKERLDKYDPADDSYISDVFEDNGSAGFTVGGICLLLAAAITIFGLVLCCVSHHWSGNMDFVGLAKRGTHWWQRVLGALFVLGIIACVLLVIAMSLWGIERVQEDVADVIPEAFDVLDEIDGQLNAITNSLEETVDNGNAVVATLENAISDLESLETGSGSTQGVSVSDSELADLQRNLDSMSETLRSVEEELSGNLEDLAKGMRDAAGHRDEGEALNDPLQIVVTLAFVCFIVFSVASLVFSLCRCSPCCTLSWAVVMWIMLTISFALVAILTITREFSEETCLYIDNFAVDELAERANNAPERMERLLTHYFQPPDAPEKSLEELEDLWGFPLSQLSESISTIESQVFDGSELRTPFDFTSADTQDELRHMHNEVLENLRQSVASILELISGTTFNEIHAHFKDLICCTEYDAVDSVWKAWVVASSFGLVIALMLTVQGLMACRRGQKPRAAQLPVGEPSETTTGKAAPLLAPEGETGSGDK